MLSEEFINLFHTVAAFDGSCRMNKGQTELYEKLNGLYNQITGFNIVYSVCNKYSLMVKCQNLIKDEQNNQQIKQLRG